jgi:hypothetical protein
MRKNFFKISINANSNEFLPSEKREGKNENNENDESSVLLSSCAALKNSKPKFTDIFPNNLDE